MPSVLSSVFFAWVTPILELGFSRPLREADIAAARTALPHWKTLCCSNALSDFERQAHDQHIMWSLYNCCRSGIWTGAVLVLGRLVILLILPLLLEQLLLFLNDSDRPAHHGWLIAFIMLVLSCGKTLLENHYYICMQRTGIRARAILVSLIFKKAMQLSPKARNGYRTGKILNLMQLDAQRFYDTAWFLHLMWSAVLEILGCVTLLFLLLGPSMLAGFLTMVLLVPLNGWLAQKQSRLSKALSKATDSRINLLSEIVNGIRAIKYGGWETSFLAQLNTARQNELLLVKKLTITRAFSSVIGQVTPSFVAVATILCYILSGNMLVTHKIFTALSLFDMLKDPLNRFPQFISSYVDLYVSGKRIQAYLNSEAVTPLPSLISSAVPEDMISSSSSSTDSSTFQLNGIFSWDDGQATDQPHTHTTKKPPRVKKQKHRYDALEEAEAPKPDEMAPVCEHQPGFCLNVDIQVATGSLVLVIGSVGAGKSSLLNALLSELTVVSGRGVDVKQIVDASLDEHARCKGIGLLTQSPWIVNATLRQNIMIGKVSGLQA
jgi:ABC-type multidrug transport system fused ATPase/permease subunit